MFTVTQIALLFLAFLAYAYANWLHDEHENNRTSKFFPFFLGPTMIRVANTQCKGDNGLIGTCYIRDECASLGGKSSGSCSKGFGRCCVIQKTCGMSTKANCTYFTSPNYPDNCKGGEVCNLVVWPCGSDVCQLRLDFKDFSLAPPDANGNCLDDFLIVTGGGSSVPRICGENTGQHVYVDFAGSSPITLSVDTNSALTLTRKWNIKITQIKCCHRAPIGCLMDYTATSGKVMSFNYAPTASRAPVSPDMLGPGTRELVNLNYGVCVEMAPGYCSIEWSQNPDDPYSFTVSNDTDSFDNTALGMAAGSLTGANCTNDFVVIPNPMQGGMMLPYDRFCGNALPTVTSASKPFVLTVVTDGSEANSPPSIPPDGANRGFCLFYRQLPCVP